MKSGIKWIDWLFEEIKTTKSETIELKEEFTPIYDMSNNELIATFKKVYEKEWLRDLKISELNIKEDTAKFVEHWITKCAHIAKKQFLEGE